MEADEVVVDFPTLFVAAAWIEAHCPIPDGFRKGQPFEHAPWQLWCTLKHYQLKPDVEWRPKQPILGPAFEHWRSLIVGPQKLGKGPGSATLAANEAVGPALFAGWAGSDDGYSCREHGCGCGWEYPYERGEAMGMPWPTPLIQLTATSEDQVRNIYDPLRRMIELGPLGDLMRETESYIACPNDGRIDKVTSSARARLGQPVTCVMNDEAGLYTPTTPLFDMADTQMRGAAGMGGRTILTTNCWDPSEQSFAQVAYESTVPGTFKFYRPPPANLSYLNKEERRKIHAYVYAGSPWVDLDSIESTAAELLARDPAQAERFFGNRLVAGSGSWLPENLWKSREVQRQLAA